MRTDEPNHSQSRVCIDCGQPFLITPDDQAFFRAREAADGLKWTLPHRCVDCRRKRRRALHRVPEDAPIQDYHFTCCDCGQTFTFRAMDVAFYSARGHCWPKRCPPCRVARRSSSPVSTRS